MVLEQLRDRVENISSKQKTVCYKKKLLLLGVRRRIKIQYPRRGSRRVPVSHTGSTRLCWSEAVQVPNSKHYYFLIKTQQTKTHKYTQQNTKIMKLFVTSVWLLYTTFSLVCAAAKLFGWSILGGSS